MINFPNIMYGGDYNPDQWPEDIWNEDIRLFKLANINIVTLPVFSWAKLQPSEDTYNFGWLDKIMDKMAQNDIKVCLATSTAAQPAWMSKKYPEVLPVNIAGNKKQHGGRVNFCPNSSVYRKFAVQLATELANRYKDNPSLLIWHIGNEYINHCYCENCAREFRNWVKNKYGTIEEVNRNWNLNFWGHTIYDFNEIETVSYLSEMGRDTWSGHDRDVTSFQGMALDYSRFNSDSTLACYLAEYEAIKKITPDIPATTNLMGFFKPMDYQKWAKKMDIISFDSYPFPNETTGNTAIKHSLMRSLKNGDPFMLMEQTPSQVNWQPANPLKKPGIMRLQSYQALAHGADTIMFFQLRKSIGACEKFHGAVIDHSGHENTRVFKECSKLGEELKNLGNKIIGSRINAKVAIMFDWDNWWALEYSSGPTVHLHYIQQIEKYYNTIYDMNIPVDIISCEDNLSSYEIVIAPVLYMVKPGLAKNIENFTSNGGTFLTTFFSGIVNENDLVKTGGYPGELRDVLGIWVEETDALLPDDKNSILLNEEISSLKNEYSCGLLCDLLHIETAKSLAVYGSDFYAGMPVLTENQFGNGRAYYIASDPEKTFLSDFMKHLFSERDIKSPFYAKSGIEITQRHKGGKTFTFILNHTNNDTCITLDNNKYLDLISKNEFIGSVFIKAKDLVILESI